jgi:hypothetical protein
VSGFGVRVSVVGLQGEECHVSQVSGCQGSGCQVSGCQGSGFGFGVSVFGFTV